MRLHNTHSLICYVDYIIILFFGLKIYFLIVNKVSTSQQLTFVLLSSIVMLVATPIVNMNNVFNVKAQGYDDYSYNDRYRTYSTDDKKYECRTGPFEGFFVSSIRIL